MRSSSSPRKGTRSVYVRKTAQWLCSAMGLLFLCLSAFSQGNFGRILGTVTDQSGGVIAGAAVTITDLQRGVTRNLTTDSAGEYDAPNLTPGTYSVRIESKGFKNIERQGIDVGVGREIRV